MSPLSSDLQFRGRKEGINQHQSNPRWASSSSLDLSTALSFCAAICSSEKQDDIHSSVERTGWSIPVNIAKGVNSLSDQYNFDDLNTINPNPPSSTCLPTRFSVNKKHVKFITEWYCPLVAKDNSEELIL